MNLHVVVCSTRPNRVGLAIGQWFAQVAGEHAGYETKLVDLAEVNLPMFDEPEHPRLRKYQNAHTKAWSASVDSADAFVFVTPEYNFGPPPAFINAVTYLTQEWAYKPAGFVSYGGISGGMRAVQMEKQVLSTLKVVTLTEAVVVPNAAAQITTAGDAGKVFAPNELQRSSAIVLLNELHRWSSALTVLRPPAA